MLSINRIPQKRDHRLDENGFASIVIALILILILSLLTVGFAQLARREQQTALAKQLAVQANYAAESGINDTIKILSSINSTNNPDPTQCLNFSTFNINTSVNSQYDVSYTCVLVNLTPNRLEKNPLEVGDGWNIIFSGSGSQGIASLNIQWQSADDQTTLHPGDTTTFDPFNTWKSLKAPAVLQTSLTPLSSLARADLITNTFTAYGYPLAGSFAGTTSYATGPSGPIVPGNCSSTTGVCTLQIQNLAGSPGENYLLHILDYYDASDIAVTGTNNDGTPTKFSGGQVVIDATGQAKDVLKRIQVYYPLNGNGTGGGGNDANYALEGQNICKRLETAPVVTNPDGSQSGGTQYNLPSGTAYSSNTNPCSFDGLLPP